MRRIVVGLLLLATSASAQSAEDIAVAEQLFREGKALYDAGQAREACGKFASSYELAGGLGTLANLARCYDTIGRTASAWALYVDLKTRATRAAQPERVTEAEARIADLEPRLCKLRVVVRAKTPGLKVRHNDEVMAAATLGVALPVDPGTHRIVVSAPGYEDFATERPVQREGEVVTIEVPALVAKPVAPTQEPFVPVRERRRPSSKPAERDHTLAWVGGVTTGAGVIVLGVAGGFAIKAANEWSDAGCDSGVCTSPAAQRSAEDAKGDASTATTLFVAGGVLAAVGAVLLITDLSADDDAPRARRARTPALRF